MGRLFLTERGMEFFGEVMHAGGHWPLAHRAFPDFLPLGIVKAFPGVAREEAIEATMDLGEGKFSKYRIQECLKEQVEACNIEIER